jgi:murein L,D-transpeptidase YafK
VGIIIHSRRNTASFLPLLLALFLSLQVVSAPSSAADATADEVWLLVDTENLSISVMRGKALLYKYDNIAIGSNGPSVARRVSDQTTPLGEFRISGINPRSRFHLFMAIDYPTMEHARSALADGRISPDEYMAVSNAWLGGEPPPQDTRLGGYLGIHGVGDGNTGIHGLVNWTDGCIAVTNEQMDELASWVGVGTRVSVR